MSQDLVAPYVEDVDKPIDYKYYLFLLRKRLYIVLTFFVIAITIAAIYASKIPDQYKTFVQVIVEQPQRAAVDVQQSVSGAESVSWSDDYYKTQSEIMTSMAVMRLVVEDLNLTSYFGNSDEEAVARHITKKVEASRLKGSRLFNIEAKAHTAQFSADLANAVARAYIRTNFESRLHYSQELLRWLPTEGEDDQVVTVELPFGGTKQMTREEIINSLPAIQSNVTLRELREKKSELESEIEFDLRRYRHKHPVIIKHKSRMKFLDQNIEEERKNIIDRLQTKAEGRHQLGYARIIEDAPVPRAPLKNDRFKIILIAALAELIITIGLIILLDFFDDTIRSVEDMERKGLILPFLGPISKVKDVTGEELNLASFHDKKSDISESFRYLRVAINFSASPEALKTLLLTSCLPHEGKSFVTHNLAASLAMDGNKTLLVDGDLRRPVLQRSFRFDNSTGLSSYLTSQLDFDDVVKETFVENLSIVGSGPVSPNPGEILGSERMKTFLKEASERFDRVIIDAPPLTGIGDGFVMGSLIGHVILVIASGKTPAELVKRTQANVDKAGVKILGTVLNMVDMEKERYGGYYKYYYHTYNRYYNK